MKPETPRELALFAARLRAHNPKDPPLLDRDSVTHLCTLFLRDHGSARKARSALRRAFEATDLGTARRYIDIALTELED